MHFGEPLGTIGAPDFKTCPALKYQKGAHLRFQCGNKMRLSYLVLANGCLYVYKNDTDTSYDKVISTKDIYRLRHENPMSGPAKGMTCIGIIMETKDSTTIKESQQWLMAANDETDRMDWMTHLYHSLLKAHDIHISMADIKKDYEFLEQPIKQLKLTKKEEEPKLQTQRYTPFEKIIHPAEDGYETIDVPQVNYPATGGGNVHIYYNISAVNVQVTGSKGTNAIINPTPGVTRLSNSDDSTTDEETSSITSLDEEKRSKQTSVKTSPEKTTLPPQKMENRNGSSQCMMPKNLMEELRTKQREAQLGNTKTRRDQECNDCMTTRTAYKDEKVVLRRQPQTGPQITSTEHRTKKERRKEVDLNADLKATIEEREKRRKAMVLDEDLKVSMEKDYMFYETNEQKAKELLRDKPNNTFLIRDSTEPGNKTLHVKLDSKITKYKITQSEDGRFYLDNKNQQFNSLNELVVYYQFHKTKTTGSRLGMGFRQR